METSQFVPPLQKNNGVPRNNVVRMLETQLLAWQDELSFYHRLLTWRQLDCKEEHRSGIDVLLAELHTFAHVNLPELRSSLGYLESEIHQAKRSAKRKMIVLRRDFEKFDQRLHETKAKIYQEFFHFVHVHIT